MTKVKRFTNFDVDKKLEALNWKGKFFSYSNIVTYLSDDNDTLAVVTYSDKFKTTISSVNFENKL